MNILNKVTFKDIKPGFNHFNAEGTMGDAYCLMCKLYPIAINEKVKIFHKTRHRFWYGAIERIYKLRMIHKDKIIQNVDVTFVEKLPRGKDSIKLKMYPFPNFKFTETLDRFKLPENYCCINLKSGRHSQKHRAIRPHVYTKIFEENENIVIIGDEFGPHPENTDNKIIDLTGKTYLWEAMEIVKRAKVFHGFQGLMSFVACSQRVPTYVYKRDDDDARAIRENIMAYEWKKYIKEIREG